MSLLMVSDFEVFTGILWHDLYWVQMGLWFTNPHKYLSNDPNSLLICFFFFKKKKKILHFAAYDKLRHKKVGWDLGVLHNGGSCIKEVELLFHYLKNTVGVVDNTSNLA